MNYILNRQTAGDDLAEVLRGQVKNLKNTQILAIPRGGVVVGAAIAEELGLPLAPLVTKKIGAPGNLEYSIGAVGPDGTPLLAEASNQWPPAELEPIIADAQEKVRRYQQELLDDKPLPNLTGKVIILVDDGIATGETVRAALAWLKTQQLKRIILAVPVIAADTARELTSEVDALIALLQPTALGSIGQWYVSFGDVPLETAQVLLRQQNLDKAPKITA